MHYIPNAVDINPQVLKMIPMSDLIHRSSKVNWLGVNIRNACKNLNVSETTVLHILQKNPTMYEFFSKHQPMYHYYVPYMLEQYIKHVLDGDENAINLCTMRRQAVLYFGDEKDAQ